jgi:2-haloacid dehalogenase
MQVNRRQCLHQIIGTAAGAVGSTSLAQATPRFKAVAFDAFPIFDPRPISAQLEQLFPGKGAQLGEIWRARQFEYQWLRALSGRYADFWQSTEDALRFAAKAIGVELTSASRENLMGMFLKLGAWPDVMPSLKSLRGAGVRLAFLSTATPKILEAGIRNAGLEGLFEHVLSTDAIRTFKPDPRAYGMAVEAFGLKREEIAFAAFAGWDAAGAKWFGFPTFWVNRLGSPAEELGVAPDGAGRDLLALASFVGVSR